MQENKSQPLILAHLVKRLDELSSWRVVRRLSVHNLPGLQSTLYSEQPQTMSDHRRIVPAIQEYDTISEFKST